MDAPDRAEVVVVGAGPTGLMLACELALAGVRCRVLERRQGQSNITRAFAVDARTLVITERIDRETSTGAPATFAPRFAALLPAGARPLLTFRVGYPARAGRPTPRRSAAMVLR